MTKEEGLEIVKNRECISCKHLFDPNCKGKPRKVDRCVRYEERKKHEQT